MKTMIWALMLLLCQTPALAAEPADAARIGKQPLQVYLMDQTAQATNIRSAPSGQIIQQLASQNGDYMLTVTEPVNGWWRIADHVIEDVSSGKRVTIPPSGGWLHYSVLGLGSRNYGGEELTLYAEPSTQAKAVFSFRDERSLRPMDAQGKWVKVMTMDGRHRGWILREWLCGNPLTNCS